MAAYISNPGQINNSGDLRAIYLKVFAGEILTQFREKNVMRDYIRMRSIPFGKSAQFPVIGKGFAVTHTPGTNMLDGANVTARKSTDPTGAAVSLGVQFAHAERTIYIDNPVIADTFISKLDEILTQYEYRQEYVTQLALSLTNTFDRTAILALIGAARVLSGATGLVTGEQGGGYNGNGGSIAVGATPTGGAITDALWQVAQRFNEQDVPMEDRAVLLPWASYFAMIKDPTLYTVVPTASGATASFVRAAALSGNFTATPTGGGAAQFANPNLMFGNANWAQGTIRSVAGFDIVPTNHIPTLDLSGTTFYSEMAGSNGNSYAYNCSSTRDSSATGATQGIVFQKSAVGCLLEQDLTTESEYKIEYQSTLFIAKMLTGFRWLRPVAAVELTSLGSAAGTSH